jgi:tetratricopeptide (TPR) repeat protein
MKKQHRRLRNLRPLPANLELLDWLARWIDLDDSFLLTVVRLVARFERGLRGRALLEAESVHFAVARALTRFHYERYKEAVGDLEYAQTLAERLNDRDLLSVTRYLLARCRWKQGRYDEALELARSAKSLTTAESVVTALIETVEAWLLFLLGNVPAALELYDRVEAVFATTDDYVNKANVLSARGRILRQAGDNDLALALFGASIRAFPADDKDHRNIARALAQMAFVKRVQANEADDAAASKLRGEGLAWLARAEAIYTKDARAVHKKDAAPPFARGLGIVYNVRALMLLDSGQRSDAWTAVTQTLSRGASKHDPVVLANARIIQCVIALDRGKPHDVLLARWCADRAVELAMQTRNRRLQIRARIWRGRAALRPPLLDPMDATKHCLAARETAGRLGWDGASDDEAPREGGSSERRRDYLERDLESLERDLAGAAHDGIFAMVTRAEVIDRRLKDILDAVETAVILNEFEKQERNKTAVTKRFTVAPRRVNEAIVRVLDDDEDAAEIASLPADKTKQMTWAQSCPVFVSDDAARQLDALNQPQRIVDAIQHLSREPLPNEANLVWMPRREMYRCAIKPLPKTRRQYVLVYELLRTPNRTANAVEPPPPLRVIVWLVRAARKAPRVFTPAQLDVVRRAAHRHLSHA